MSWNKAMFNIVYRSIMSVNVLFVPQLTEPISVPHYTV